MTSRSTLLTSVVSALQWIALLAAVSIYGIHANSASASALLDARQWRFDAALRNGLVLCKEAQTRIAGWDWTVSTRFPSRFMMLDSTGSVRDAKKKSAQTTCRNARDGIAAEGLFGAGKQV